MNWPCSSNLEVTKMNNSAAENPSEFTGEEGASSGVNDPTIAEEIRLLRLVDMVALIMKPHVEEEYMLTSQVVYLPIEYVASGALFEKGALNQELLAVALAETIKRLQPHGPTKLLASSLLSRARS